MTYFRELRNPKDEIMLEKALKAINADNKDKKKDVLSPLLVLEILKEKPKLKFSVIKTYLLNRLQV